MSDTVQSSQCNVCSIQLTRNGSQLTNQQPTIAETPTGFLSLPSELRNEIYELILLCQEPIDPCDEYNRRQQQLTLGLLRTNKAVHDEASSLFYSRNRFDFTNATPEEVSLFIEKIGSSNAGCIRHILIEFPQFLHLGSDDVTLVEDSASILAIIQSGCANLSTLTTSIDSTSAMESRLDGLDNYKVATEVLNLVDARFKAISSLQHIILEVYEDGPSDHIRRAMESYGWTMNTREYVEEDEGYSIGGFSDFEDGYRYYGDDSDDYDIDNDSDFWRRAAD
ncbi:hypothetical protein QBC33DRAFT_457687 [Phialemonium atrogriseum]|uniref:F-box domain-containing protein n=1 Tax=Phialemonium atrogriseum TaxID=1093897 RepID=A0AAJ0BW77_9PEZI|nr:uncharacterized protein QBC33DRAFT_457687 [Phialemonium atrogriseum]KAK1764239.1 hypothetical protein QBC33DRAFT_457687 [Phialemonium atrogriseum]